MSETRSAKLETAELALAEYGDPAGEPVMYFHGWPGSRLQAKLADRTAREDGWRVVAPDRPGLGQSPFCPERSIAGWPALVAELADWLGWAEFSILAVSGGGPYAQACAAMIPKRLKAVMIISGVPHQHWVEKGEGLTILFKRALAVDRLFPGALRPALWMMREYVTSVKDPQSLVAKLSTLPEPDRKALSDPETFSIVLESLKEAFDQTLDGIMLDGRLIGGNWGFDQSSITMPLTLWHGRLDTVCPIGEVEEGMGRIPSASLRIFDQHGHYSLPIVELRAIFQEFRRHIGLRG